MVVYMYLVSPKFQNVIVTNLFDEKIDIRIFFQQWGNITEKSK